MFDFDARHSRHFVFTDHFVVSRRILRPIRYVDLFEPLAIALAAAYVDIRLCSASMWHLK